MEPVFALNTSSPACPPADASASAEPSSTDWAALLGPRPFSEGELRALQGLALLRHSPLGERVFMRGQRAPNLIAVVSGIVGVGALGEDGQFHLERAVHGPLWLDNSSAWLGAGHSQDAQTLSPAVLLDLPLQGLRRLLTQYPQMNERLLCGLAQTVQGLAGATHELMAKDAQKRLATWLLQRSPPEGAALAMKERKRELAAQLAITPETLSRLLRQLMSAGLIEVKGYSIKLLNLSALRTLAHD